jgi:hypothetical protein
MERGYERLFADLARSTTTRGRPVEHLRVTVEAFAEAFDRNDDFMRLLVAMAAQPPDPGEVLAVMKRSRKIARLQLKDQIRIAFGPDIDDDTADHLAHFAHAALDGAFVSQQIEPDVSLHKLVACLPTALVAIRRELAKRAKTAD